MSATGKYLWLAAFVVGFLFLGPAAFADEPPNPQELFDRLTDAEEQRVIELIDEGQEFYDDGEFQRATRRFHEVFELFPHPNIGYQLGRCYEQLNDYEMAIQYYGRFLEQSPNAEQRGRIEQTIQAMEDELGEDISSVRVETFPIGADVYVGQRETVPVGETPESVILEPGTHDIFVEMTGYESVETSVEVIEGEQTIVQFELEQDDSERIEDPDRTADQSTVSWWKPVVSVGLFGIGGLTTYQAFSHNAAAQNHQDTLDEMSSGDPNYSDVEHQRDQSLNMARTMGVTAGVTLVGGTVFTAWWLLRDRNTGTLNVGVSPSRHGINVGLYGRF